MKSIRILFGAINRRGWRWTIRRLKDELCAWRPLLCRSNGIPMYWFYSKSSPNFGDALNPWLYEKITGRAPVRVKTGYKKKHVLAIGTILNRANSASIVWGSGGCARKAPNEIFALRGPLSAASLNCLGVSSPPVYGDPGLLVSLYYKPNVSETSLYTIVPHVHDYELVANWFKSDSGIRVIDLRADVDTVLDQIASSRLVISSSLHGVVVSHSYGVPVVWAIFRSSLCEEHPIGSDKFIDYLLGVGVRPPYCPVFFANNKIEDLSSVDWDAHVLSVPDGRIEKAQQRLLDVCPFVSPSRGERDKFL